MEEVMKRQIKNAITSLAITVFAGLGVMAFGQSPQPACPSQPVAQPVVIQQTEEQTCPQPTVIKQTVEDFVVQPVAQPQTCTQQTTVCCADMCELVRSIESNADDLRKYFRRSARCLDCIDDSYYESVKEFERATDRLKKEYKRDCEKCDITQEVQEVLSLANCISAYMDPCSLCPEAISAWSDLTCDLQTLAGAVSTYGGFRDAD